MKSHLIVILLLVSLLLLFYTDHGFNKPAQSFQTTENISNFPILKDSNLKVNEIVKGLFMPTSISFIGNDDFIITQKNGTVSRVINNTLMDKPLLTLNVASGFYQGLLGSAVSKNNTSNSTYVFLSFIEPNTKNSSNSANISDTNIKFGHKIYRYELVGNKLTSPMLLLQLPSTPGPENNGGYITIGPDKNLYTIIGNVMNPVNETAVRTLASNFINGSIPDGRSAILRITQDGLPVKDGNESITGTIGKGYPLNLYYAYGIHNGFGLDFDPVSGYLWDTETGHNEFNDEINLVKQGFNSGFGVIQGMSKFFPNIPFELVNFNGSGKYADPEFTWMQKAVPTGLKFLTSDKLGNKYKNELFVGTFNAGKIYNFDLNINRTQLMLPQSLESRILLTLNSTGSDKIEFGRNFGGISGISVGPDGNLYVVGVTNGAIYKISSK